MKVTHLESVEELNALNECFFKYRDTIIIGGSMIHNHMEYELKRDVSKILGEKFVFIEFKNTYEISNLLIRNLK